MFSSAARVAARRAGKWGGAAVSAARTPATRAVHARFASALGTFEVPDMTNEPFLHYPPGSEERAELRRAMDKLLAECPDIPCVVNGEEVRTGNVQTQVMPTRHAHTLCTYHQADEATLKSAAAAACAARADWARMPVEDRLAIFMKAADLLSTKYRAELCAAVMLGTGKNVWQAEIDAAVELIDFWRFGAKYAAEIYQMQPPVNEKGVWNRMEFRPLEGFVVAISPFNFIAIGGNLNSAPAIMGNTTVWKPASTAILGSYVVYKILKEAGLPDGVINFTPGAGRDVGTHLIKHPNMAGLHFTGGTGTFNHIWREIGENLENYGSYPRIVGETGGKNFHFVHSSADPTHVVMNTIRGAFEYQGQKCSATSRMYAPSNLWPEIKKGLVETLATVKMGCVTEFDSFMCAVIDGASFNNIKGYIDEAKASPECEIIAGGNYDDSVGYFVEPTIIVTTNPRYRSMQEEIFGPVLTIYVYEADKFEETLELCNTTSPYALTGAVFAQDRAAVVKASAALRDAAGNFYINDKCTGSIVGQQPFGGARQSGTNDKSGSAINLLRWTSVRSIKENFIPITDYRYPSVSSKE